MSTAGSPYTDSQIRKQLSTNQIGGGQPYLDTLSASRQITEADCDVTVSTSSGFWNAVKGTTYSRIWVADNAVINISGDSARVTDKTIAGNRGVNGADGPLLYSTDRGEDSHAWGGGASYGHLVLEGSSRLTGLRLRGWSHDYWDNPEHPGYIPFAPGATYAERDAWRKKRFARCGSLRSDDVEIDNCEIYGWSVEAFACGTSSSHHSPWIHHNDLHDNMMTSYGYHIDVKKGRPVVEYNYMNAHRHAVNGFGYYNSEFVCRFNLFGPSQSSHATDMHGLHNNVGWTNSDYNSTKYHGQAGGRMEIYRNTYTATHVISDDTKYGGNWTWAISIRGVPSPRTSPGVQIYDNVFEHPKVERNGGGNGVRDSTHNGPYNQQISGVTPDWSVPTGSDGFTANYSHGPNVFEGSTTDYDYNTVGAPINLEGADEIPPKKAQLRVYPRSERKDGDPIEGAMVTIEPYEDISEWYSGPYEVESAYEMEYDGVYARFDGLPVGDYDITVEHPSYETNGINGLYLDETGRQPIVTMDPLREAEPTSPLTITVIGDPTADQSFSAFPTRNPSTVSESSDTGADE